MAPFKRMRTYQKLQANMTGSESAFNDLLAKNLTKRFECSLDRTTDKAETTFDRLFKTKSYNPVILRKFPENKFTEDTSTRESTTLSDNGLEASSISRSNNSDGFNKPFERQHENRSKQDSSRNVVTRSSYRSSKTTERIGSKKCNAKNLEKSTIGNIEAISDLSNQSLNNLVSTKNNQGLSVHNNSLIVDSSPDFKGFSSEQNKLTKKIHNDYLILSLEMADKGTESSSCVVDVSEKTQNEPQENVSNNIELASLICSKNELLNKYTPVLRKLRRRKNVSLAPSNSNHDLNQLKTSKDSLSLTQDISSFLEYENSLMRHNQNIKAQLLISSTPLQSEKKQIFVSTTEDKENYSPIKKSYETIDLWNYKCPSPSSFVIKKKLSINNKSVSIGRKNKWKRTSKKGDKNCIRSATVRLKRIPQLDNILEMKKNHSTLNIRSLLLAINNNRSSSIICSKRKNRKKKAQKKMSNKQELVNPVVLLTPLETSEINSIRDTKKIKQRNTKHVCSRQCECFERQPIVMLEKFDCFIQHRLIQKPQEAITIINISDSDSEPSVLVHTPANRSIFDLDASSISKSLEESVSNKLDKSEIGASYHPTLKSHIDVDDLITNSSTEVTKRPRNAYAIGSSSNNKTKNVIKDCHILLNRMDQSISEHSLSDNLSHHSVTSKKSIDNCNAVLEEINDTCQHHRLEKTPQVPEISSDCDIIESSITLPTNTFKRKTKYINLAPGKKYRRSRVIWKIAKESLDVSEQHSGYDRQESIRLNRRISVKLLPVRREKNRISDLNVYASNSTGYGYVSNQEATLGDFENEFQNLFTSINASNPSVHGSIINYTARDIVLRKCGQTEPLKFEKCYPSSLLQNCQKIGEGVFGEVFMFREKDGSITVMKIIPIEGDQMVNMEKQKTFEEIISEIVISTELSNLRETKQNSTDTFTEVKKIRCVEGCYPDRLMYLWELYDENKKSENDSPEIFNQNQLYIVLELSNGGCDLEAFEFSNGQQSLSVFKQVAVALAVAENELQFEHRDLHWGNVLVTPTRENKTVFILDGKEIEFDNKGVKATIIDFTLSRMEHEGVIIFNDLAMDEELFTAKGDYQFEIYRLMQKHNENIWQNFKPYTNILWLHYMLDKMIDKLRYKNIKSRLHKDAIRILKLYKNEILQYESVCDFVWNNLMK